MFRTSPVLACAVLAALTPVAARSGEPSGFALRISAAGGFDTNAGRAYDSFAADGSASVLLAADYARLAGDLQLSGAYDGGYRKFLLYPGEDTLIQSLQLEAAYPVRRWLRLGLELTGKDRRGAARDYTDLAARPFVEFAPDPRVELRVSGAARRFLYHASFPYSFAAGEGSATARYRFDRSHSAMVFADFGARRHDADARPPPGTSESPGVRHDTVLTFGAGYSFRGPFTASVLYSFLDHASNSYGERLNRHRLSATGGFRLPWQAMLFAQLTLQLTSYPDGIFLSPLEQLQEDDETHNAVSLKLSRPLSEQLDVELRYSAYLDFFVDTAHRYQRQVAFVGLTFRM